MKTGENLIRDINNCENVGNKFFFWWLGQMGFVIKAENKVIYIDGFFSNLEERTVPPIIEAELVTNADYVLGTHNHLDHIDIEAWKIIARKSPNCIFVVPGVFKEYVRKELQVSIKRVIGMDTKTTVFLDENLQISGIPSAHEFLDYNSETEEYPYLGYIIEGRNWKIYHAGDTCLYEEIWSNLRKKENYDVMFLPINGRDAVRYQSNTIGNMTYQEAVDLAGVIRPKMVVPGHYDMFQHNSENPLLFQEYLQSKYKGIECWIGDYGEIVKIY